MCSLLILRDGSCSEVTDGDCDDCMELALQDIFMCLAAVFGTGEGLAPLADATPQASAVQDMVQTLFATLPTDELWW